MGALLVAGTTSDAGKSALVTGGGTIGCLTVIANEQVKEGRCERCDSPVVERQMPEWAFRITRNSEDLLQALDGLTAASRNAAATTLAVGVLARHFALRNLLLFAWRKHGARGGHAGGWIRLQDGGGSAALLRRRRLPGRRHPCVTSSRFTLHVFTFHVLGMTDLDFQSAQLELLTEALRAGHELRLRMVGLSPDAASKLPSTMSRGSKGLGMR